MKNLKRFFKLFRYLNRNYYTGRMIRWHIADKKGKSVYCSQCGNIANGCTKEIIFGVPFRIPYCKKHLVEIYWRYAPDCSMFFPCELDLDEMNYKLKMRKEILTQTVNSTPN